MKSKIVECNGIKISNNEKIVHAVLEKSSKPLKAYSILFEIQKKRIHSALLNSSSEEVINFDNVLKKIING